ncbi:MAG TPA: hypothetical protein VF456_22810 [Vicinamibacterales bacterium]
MRVSSLASVISVLAVIAVVPSAAGQSGKYSPPRTADGKPDLQGTYTFATITPLQRPAELAGKAVLTPEEAANFEKKENDRLNRDLYTPEKGQPSAGYPPQSQGGVLSYNDFWYERGDKLTKDLRTSLITDPPDGRIPLTAEARQRNAQRAARGEMFDNPEDLSLVDQCILGFNAGPPMVSGTYNNNLQIVQSPGYVVIFNEMVHNARIVPTDGRPHGTAPMWTGDSRGHWEGDTLVVETLNFKRETSSLQGSTAQTKVVERFKRVDARTLDYQYTVTDPTSYTQPWTASMPLRAIDENLYEYACHEGNFGMMDVLRGARFRDKEKEAAGKQ